MTDEIRIAYSKAKESESNLKVLEKLLKEQEPTNVVIKAYLGCLEALKGKYAWLPFQKLVYVDNATHLLNRAVKEASEDIEIRFLRFSIEISLPAFLAKSHHIEQDKISIIENIAESKLSKEFLSVIADFVVKSGKCNKTEQKFLEKYV
jgi:hypothetical protein